MVVYSVWIISKAGSLIFDFDNARPAGGELEKTFGYPLDLALKVVDSRVLVNFGARDGIKVGQCLLAVNGKAVDGTRLHDGSDIMAFLETPASYPVDLKFGQPRMRTNEKIVLASTLHSLCAISAQLRPGSSGLQQLDTDAWRLFCMQTRTGVKFVTLVDHRQPRVEQLLERIYELYADYALKNPFYALDMPIRAHLFDQHLRQAIVEWEKQVPQNAT